MAKGIYAGTESLARKVKKMYVGVDGKARKVKKGYIGVGGLARLFFSGDPTVLVFDREIATTLSALRYHQLGAASCSVNKNGIFAGGNTNTGGVADVVAISPDLAISEPQVLENGRRNAIGQSTSSRFVIAGGNTHGGFTDDSVLSSVEVYDSDFTKESNAAPLQTNVSYHAGVRVEDKLLFGGGQKRDDSPYETDGMTPHVTAYSDDLTRTYAPDLSPLPANARCGVYRLAAATAGKYAVFAGGSYVYWNNKAIGKSLDYSWAYDSQLTLSPGPNLPSGARTGLMAGNFIEGPAVFLGGYTDNKGNIDESPSKYVDSISEDLTASAMPQLVNNFYHRFGPPNGVNYKELYLVFGASQFHKNIIYDKDYTILPDPAEESSVYANGYDMMVNKVLAGDYCVVVSTDGDTSGNYGTSSKTWTYNLAYE